MSQSADIDSPSSVGMFSIYNVLLLVYTACTEILVCLCAIFSHFLSFYNRILRFLSLTSLPLYVAVCLSNTGDISLSCRPSLGGDRSLQESLANTKVSAQQQCVYEGPQRRNLRQISARNQWWD